MHPPSVLDTPPFLLDAIADSGQEDIVLFSETRPDAAARTRVTRSGPLSLVPGVVRIAPSSKMRSREMRDARCMRESSVRQQTKIPKMKIVSSGI